MPNFNDTNIRILWCAAWNQAAQIYHGTQVASINAIEELAKNLFAGMLKPYEPKPEPLPFNPSTDSASDLEGEYPGLMNPKRNDKKV